MKSTTINFLAMSGKSIVALIERVEIEQQMRFIMVVSSML